MSASDPTGDLLGGNGGDGGLGNSTSAGDPTATGGGGGAGGFGFVYTGAGPLNLLHNLTGGEGGAGGGVVGNDYSLKAGRGGTGGGGLFLTESGASATIGSNVVVSGGKGGASGKGLGDHPLGGVGISGSQATVTLSSTATVSGGLDTASSFRANAITLTGGGNIVNLNGNGAASGSTYATVKGTVLATGGNNTLGFTGLGGVFDLSLLNASETAYNGQYRGFGNLTISTSGTWVATEAQLTDARSVWDVVSGTLQLGSALKIASIEGDVTVEKGGTLSTVASPVTGSATSVAAIAGTLTVKGALAVTQPSSSNAQSLGVTDLTLKNGSTLKFTLEQANTNALVNASGKLSINHTALVISAGKYIQEGSYALISYGSSTSTLADFSSVTGPDGYTVTLNQDASSKLLTLIVALPDLYWNGTTTTGTTGPVVGGDGTWRNDTSVTNWTNAAGTARQGFGGKGAVFAGTAGTVTVEGNPMFPLSATSLTFKTTGYVIAGATLSLGSWTGLAPIRMEGAGVTATIKNVVGTQNGIEVLGGGTLVLTNNDSHLQGATITNGTLQIGDGGAQGSISGAVTNNSKLVINRSDDVTFDNAVSGTGSLEKKGAGTLTLTAMTDATSGYTGVTTVTEGTLVFAGAGGKDSALGGGVTVASGATLSVAPSSTAGNPSLTVTDLTFLTGSTLKVKVGAPSSVALVKSTGTFVYNGTLNIASDTSFAVGSYALVAYTGQIGSGSSTTGTITGPSGYTLSTSLDAVNHLLILNVSLPDFYWNGTTTTGSTGPVAGGDGTWTSDASATNWTGEDGTGRLVASSTQTAYFAGTAGTVTVDGKNGQSPVSAAGLTFKVDGYKIVGDPLTLSPSSGTAKVTVAGSGLTATIGSVLATTQGLELLGGGTLVLTGENTYTGGTTITAGTLKVGDGGTKGSIGGDVTNNGKLIFDRSNDVEFAGLITGGGSLEKKGAGTLTLVGLAVAGPAYGGTTTVSEGTLAISGRDGSQVSKLGGGVTVASGAALAIKTDTEIASLEGAGSVTIGNNTTLSLVGATGSTTFSGVLSGNGTFSQKGTGTVILSGADTIGRLSVGAGTVVLSGGATVAGAMSFQAGGVVELANKDASVGGIVNGSAGAGTIKLNAQTLILTGSAATDFSGIIGGTGGLTMSGTGMQTLSGKGTFTGPVLVSKGTLELKGGAALSDTVAVTVNSPGMLTVTDMSQTIGSLAGGGTVRGNSSTAGAITLTVGKDNTSTTFSGSLVDLALIKVGTGTLTLSGFSSYSGGTTISAGALQIGDGSTTGGIVGDITNNASLIVNRSDALSYGGVVSGSGTLLKAGGGTLTVTGQNTFTGQTTVSAGTLQVSGGGRLTGNVTVQKGATLEGDLSGTARGNLGVVTIEDGGTLKLISAAMSLAAGGIVTLGSGANLSILLGAPAMASAMNIFGDLTLGGKLNITAGTGFATGTYRLFTFGGSLSGSGLTIGDAPDDSLYSIDTATAHQVNLTVAAGQYWNGTTTSTGGTSVAGGTGTWDGSTTNWTDRTGHDATTLSDGALAIFAGTAGKVTVSDAASPKVAGLTFRTDGYEITGGTLTLTGFAGSTTTRISVQDDSLTSGGTATISSALGGSQTVDKEGKGTLILSGQNEGYTGNVTVSEGTLVASGGHAIGHQSSVSVAKDATFVIKGDSTIDKVSGPGSIVLDSATLTVGSDGTDGTLEGTFSGSGGLTKKGAGTLTVTGQNAYTGSTTVSEGVLDVQGAGKIAGDVVVQDKARLAGEAGSSVDGTVHVNDGGTLEGGPGKGLAMGGLDVSGKGTVSVMLTGSTSSTSVFDVKKDVTLGGTLAVTPNPSFGLGVYRVLDYGGTLTDNGMGVSGLGTGLVGGLQTSIAHQVNLIVESANTPALSFWNGSSTTATQSVEGGAGTWTSDQSHTNWINASGTIPRASSNGFMVFQGQGGDVTVDTSAGAIAPTGLQFAVDGYALRGGAVTLSGTGKAVVRVGDGSTAGASIAATIASDLTGTGGVEKTDEGTLILVGTKSYTGGTTVSGGTLQLGDGTSSGSVTGDITNNASVVFAPGSAQTYAGAISGTGNVTMQGRGTLSLSGTSSYTGDTTVATGRLNVDGSLTATKLVTVRSGATLGGSGTVDAPVLVEAGGTLAGVQGQTLTMGSLELSKGAHVSAQLGESANSSALLSVKGKLTLNGVLDVDSTTGKFGTGLYRIISYTGALSGDGLSMGTLSHGANVPDLAVQSDTVNKSINLITKPTEASFWNGGKPGAGSVQGGDGTWTADTIWTNASATNSTGILKEATAIFTGMPGTVKVDAGKGAVSVAGMQFASTGYTVTGDALTVQPTGLTVRVGDGTREGASMTALISAPVTGAGWLRKTDYGTLVLSGENTYEGGTSVVAGTLKLATAKAVGSGSVSLSEGTTLAFDGDMSLSNPISFPEAGDPIIDTGDHRVTVGGVIDGIGDLSKIGSGTLVLTGVNTYTGATDVVNGTLVVDGSISASSGVKVESGATLGGFGTVAGLAVLSGATVAPGVSSPYATLNVKGSVSFAAGSTFRVQIDASGRTDSLSATGAATLSGGTVDVRAGTGTYAVGQTYRILKAAGGVTGRFEGLSASTNLAFLQPSLGYDATGVNVGFTRTTTPDPTTGGTGSGSGGTTGTGGATGGTGGSSNGTGATGGTGGTTDPQTSGGSGGGSGTGGGTVVRFASVAVTANQRAAAAAVEALGSGRLYQGVLSQTAQGARQAFDAVSGEAHVSAMSAAIEDSRVVRDVLFGRLQELGAEASPSRPGAQFGPGLWGTGFGTFGRMGSDGNASRMKRALSGFVLGADARLDAPGLDGWRVGVAGGYTDDTLSVGARSSRGDLKTVFGGAYAGATYGSLDVKLGLLGGGTQVTTQRTVLFPGFMDSTHSRRDGTLVQGFGELGYRISIPGGFVEPVVQGAVIHLDQAAVSETGGAAALRVLRSSSDVATTTAGLRGEVRLSAEWPLLARGFVGWRHAFGDVSPKGLVAFGGAGSVFAVSGVPVDQDALVAELGLGYQASDAIRLGVSYSAQAGQRASDQGVKGQFEVRF